MQEEEEEEEEQRNGVAEDEEMAEANGDAGGAGALSLANGAGPLHDEDDEEPENAVVLHEVCASLRCVASTESSLAGLFPATRQESMKESDSQRVSGACFGSALALARHVGSARSAGLLRGWKNTAEEALRQGVRCVRFPTRPVAMLSPWNGADIRCTVVQDKKYYPTAEETFGKETETLVMEEDAQPLEVRCF